MHLIAICYNVSNGQKIGIGIVACSQACNMHLRVYLVSGLILHVNIMQLNQHLGLCLQPKG